MSDKPIAERLGQGRQYQASARIFLMGMGADEQVCIDVLTDVDIDVYMNRFRCVCTCTYRR